MTSVDATGRILAQIREQAGAIAGRPAPAAKPGTTAPPKGTPRPGLQTLVAQRVQAIGAEDPQRRRKAFRIFLESVLVSEMGNELINDPAFHSLVDQVQQAMESDPQLRPAINDAGDYLLSSARQKT
jgi:hypothetical protein